MTTKSNKNFLTLKINIIDFINGISSINQLQSIYLQKIRDFIARTCVHVKILHYFTTS